MAFVTTVFARPNGSGKTALATAMRERLAHTAIFPDTYNRLAVLEADVLVTHEAPGCHRHGFEELDLLAGAMGVRWIVHGHHHQHYKATLDNGISVIGLGRAQPLVIEMGLLSVLEVPADMIVSGVG